MTPSQARSQVDQIRKSFGNPKRVMPTASDFAWVSWKAADIKREGRVALKALRADLDQILALPAESRSFDSVVIEYDTVWSRFATVMERISFIANFFRRASERDAALEVQKFLDEESRKLSMDSKVYAFLRPYLVAPCADLLDERLRTNYQSFFRMMGFELSPANQRMLRSILNKATLLELDFSQAINVNQFTLWLHPIRDIAGLTDAFLSRLSRDTRGYYGVQTKSAPDVITFLETSTNRDLRRKMLLMQNKTAGKGNLARLEKLRALRDQHAKLLGYRSFFEMQTSEGTAAGSQKRVDEFLATTRQWVIPEAAKDLAMLKTAAKRRGNTEPLESWDIMYESHLVYKKAFSVDDEEIREYFPVQETITRVWKLWETVLGIRITLASHLPTWSPDVQAFIVSDTKGSPRGTIFVDLFPREGKFSHVGVVFPIARGFKDENTYQLPGGVIGMNISAGVDASFSYSDLQTFIHESGHALHTTLARGPYGSMSGFLVKADFLELPSQFAESWTDDVDELRKLSGHKVTGKPLPRPLAERLTAANGYQKAWSFLRQTGLAYLDKEIHSTTSGASIARWEKIQKTFGMLQAPIGSLFPARFGHMAGGYEGRYWTYSWAEQYIAQCWDVFVRDGKRSSKLGRQYREMILEMGDAVEPEALVMAFSGKRVDPKSYLRSMTSKVKLARQYVGKYAR